MPLGKRDSNSSKRTRVKPPVVPIPGASCMVRWGFFIEKFRDREYSLCYNTCMRMCEFIKDGDTDEVKNTYYCGLRCDHPAAAASFFSASLYGFSQTQARHVQESSSQASDSSQMVYDISLAQSSSNQVKLMAKDMILTATIILVFYCFCQ